MKTRKKPTKLMLYLRERNAALHSLSIERYESFYEKWQIEKPAGWANPLVPLYLMHTARLHIATFTLAEKLVSAKWLVANNFELPFPIYLVNGVLVGVEDGVRKLRTNTKRPGRTAIEEAREGDA